MRRVANERAEDRVTEGTAATQAGPAKARDSVAVRLPATSAYLSVLRSVTAGLAAQLDFTLDEIEDLRIAVDEACGLLIGRRVAGGELDCDFSLSEDAMRVGVSVATVDGTEPARDSFAWHVLGALVDEVHADADGDQHVSIVLHKRRGSAERT